MDPFSLGLIVLGVCTVIFFIVLFSFIFYWHLVKISFVVVPAIFTFEFLVMGFFVVILVSIVVQYVPEIIKIAGS